MKKGLTLAIITLILCSLCSCATGGTPTSGTVSLDEALTNITVELGSKVSGKTEIVIAALKAPNSQTSEFLTAELTAHLTRNGAFIVLERGEALQAVDAEQQFQMSGLVSDESAVGIGHYLGAKVVVTGTFDPYAGFSQLRLRAVDVESSQLLAMPSSRIHPKDSVLANVMPKNAGTQRTNEQAMIHLNLGIDLLRENMIDEALRELNQAIALDKRLADAYFYRGGVYYDKAEYFLSVGNWDIDQARDNFWQALGDYGAAARLNPNDIGAHFNLGLTRREFYSITGGGSYKEPIKSFTRVLQLSPNFAPAYAARGLTYYYQNKRGDLDQAIMDFNLAVRLDPNNSVFYKNRGLVYHEKHEYDKAIADFTQAIQISQAIQYFGMTEVAYYLRGRSYRDKGDFERAVADWETVLQINPNETWGARKEIEQARGQ